MTKLKNTIFLLNWTASSWFWSWINECFACFLQFIHNLNVKFALVSSSRFVYFIPAGTFRYVHNRLHLQLLLSILYQKTCNSNLIACYNSVLFKPNLIFMLHLAIVFNPHFYVCNLMQRCEHFFFSIDITTSGNDLCGLALVVCRRHPQMKPICGWCCMLRRSLYHKPDPVIVVNHDWMSCTFEWTSYSFW